MQFRVQHLKNIQGIIDKNKGIWIILLLPLSVPFVINKIRLSLTSNDVRRITLHAINDLDFYQALNDVKSLHLIDYEILMRCRLLYDRDDATHKG